MAKEISAMLRKESVEGGRQMSQQSVARATGGGTEISFEFGEGQFDGIEIGTIRWKENELGSAAFDGGGDRGAFVGGEIVGDDDIARRQSRAQAVLDIGGESGSIHGAIEQPRRGQAIVP